MAVAFGEITPVSGSSVTVTGLSFQPVAVMLFGVHTAVTNVSQCFGVASGTTEQWTLWTGFRQEASGYLERHAELRNDKCVYLYNTADHTVVQTAATLNAFTSDGFTLAFTGAGSSQPIFYMAIGGKNIAGAHAGTFSTPASTGTVAVTGTGFDPRALVVAHPLHNALNTQLGSARWGLGFAAGANQFASFALALQGSAVAGNHIQRTDAVACAFSGSTMYRAALDSFDANGFTVNVTNAWIDSLEHGYLAIDTTRAVVGVADFPDSTGVVSYSTPAMEPGGVLFGWNGADSPSTTGSSTMPVRPGVGAMDGVATPFPKNPAGSITGLHRDTAPFGAYQPLQTWRPGEALHIRGAGGQTDPDATTDFSIGMFDAFAMGSFDLDWTTASTNSRQFGWLALPGELPAPWIPKIYRRVVPG